MRLLQKRGERTFQLVSDSDQSKPVRHGAVSADFSPESLAERVEIKHFLTDKKNCPVKVRRVEFCLLGWRSSRRFSEFYV